MDLLLDGKYFSAFARLQLIDKRVQSQEVTSKILNTIAGNYPRLQKEVALYLLLYDKVYFTIDPYVHWNSNLFRIGVKGESQPEIFLYDLQQEGYNPAYSFPPNYTSQWVFACEVCRHLGMKSIDQEIEELFGETEIDWAFQNEYFKLIWRYTQSISTTCNRIGDKSFHLMYTYFIKESRAKLTSHVKQHIMKKCRIADFRWSQRIAEEMTPCLRLSDLKSQTLIDSEPFCMSVAILSTFLYAATYLKPILLPNTTARQNFKYANRGDMPRTLGFSFNKSIGQVSNPVDKKSLESLYRVVINEAIENDIYLPVIDSYSMLMRIRNNKDIQAFRSTVNHWISAIQAGDLTVYNSAKREVNRAAKAVKKIKTNRCCARWINYLSVPANFVLPLGLALSGISIMCDRYQNKLKKQHDWILSIARY